MVAFNSLGLDMARSFVYGFICSLLAPSGYGRYEYFCLGKITFMSALCLPMKLFFLFHIRCREPESQPFGLSLMSRMSSSHHGRSASQNTVTVTFTSGPYQGNIPT